MSASTRVTRSPRVRRLALAAVAAATVAGLLTACAGSDVAATGAVDGDGDEDTFVIALQTNPPHFNVALTTAGDAEAVASTIYEPLIKLADDFSLLPGLAESWSANDAATSFTLNLQPDATWQDGKPFTSADVQFYFDEMLPLYPLGATVSNIYVNTDTPDEHTAVVNLSSPYGPFFETLTAMFMSAPKHLYEGTDYVTNPVNLEPVGTGPYEFESFTSGDSVVVNKSDTYWGQQGDVDTIIYRVMPDANARALALQSGDIDMTYVPISQFQQFDTDPNFELVGQPSPEQFYGMFNTANPVLAEAKVRQALYMAMDRESIADKVFLGTAEASKYPIPNQIEWANEESTDLLEEFPFDLETAAEMLDEAGYQEQSNGSRFSLTISYRTDNPTWASTAEIIKADFAKIGVTLDLVAIDPSIFVEQIFTNQQFDVLLLQLGSYSDPSLGNARAYVSNPDKLAFRNATGLSDPAIDEAFAAAQATSDRAERVTDFAEATDAIAASAATVPLESIILYQAIRADRWSGIDDFMSVNKGDWSRLTVKG